MGFLNASTSFTRYKITEPVPKELWPEIPEKLRMFSFKEIEETAENAAGVGYVLMTCLILPGTQRRQKKVLTLPFLCASIHDVSLRRL